MAGPLAMFRPVGIPKHQRYGSFQDRLNSAVERVREVLDAAKCHRLAEDVHHEYQDKYLLAETTTCTAVASQVNCLAVLGLDAEKARQLHGWAQSHGVSLQFRAEEHCTFVREVVKEEEGSRKHVQTLRSGDEVQAELTSKVIHTSREYVWQFDASYELTAVHGVGKEAEDRLRLLGRAGQHEIKTSSDVPPYPKARVPATAVDVNISWLFKHLTGGALTPTCGIDRSHAKCHTPVRNPDVDAALQHFSAFSCWTTQVIDYLFQLFNVQKNHGLDLNAIRSLPQSIFVPVIPLFRESGADAEGAPAEGGAEAGLTAYLRASEGQSESILLGAGDVNALLAEERRGLLGTRSALSQAFPDEGGLLTIAEATLCATLEHCADICWCYDQCIKYIEGLLRKQLIAAIGKEVQPAEFAEYMRFHNRRLFAEAYAPAPFCFAIRRSEHHSREGTLSIEHKSSGPGGEMPEPIVTCAARAAGLHKMRFPLSSSVTVSFSGDCYLHAFLSHKFTGQAKDSLDLVARACQFSSLIVLVGRIVSANVFQPKHAAVVADKAELTLPLELSTIPTPKEFKDAISSLSPEQQQFAKAFRSLQLEGTLFGILVIQIKPQLEKVLNLPEDSLTKEIKLTQDLMQLFVKYQIPSDLLSYDAGGASSNQEVVWPLEAVRSHAKTMQEMIEQAKKEELEERKREREMERKREWEWEKKAVVEEEEEEEMDFDLFDGGMVAESARECEGRAPRLMAVAAPAPRLIAAATPAPRMKGGAPQMQAMRCRAAPMGGGMPRAAGKGGSAPTEAQGPPQPAQAGQSAPAGDPGSAPVDAGTASLRDYTKVPKELDRRFERLDQDNALRPVIINTGNPWTKKSQKSLLTKPDVNVVYPDEQKVQRDEAFDLLDALTRSGALSVDHTSLHIMVAAAHCFDKTVMDTVIQDNVNPIDKVERSALIIASTVHQLPVSSIVNEAQCPRIASTSPMLFADELQSS